MTFIIYYIILFIGAAIIMYIEAEELKEIPLKDNTTKKLEGMLKTELNISVNRSTLDKLIAISSKIALETKKQKDQQWKRRISWGTLHKWKYFTHITLTTVGKVTIHYIFLSLIIIVSTTISQTCAKNLLLSSYDLALCKGDGASELTQALDFQQINPKTGENIFGKFRIYSTRNKGKQLFFEK